MDLDEHARHLGGLIGNLHSLEFVLRGYLFNLPGAKPSGLPHGADIYDLPIGAEIPVSDITSYATLGTLIRKFNNEMIRLGKPQLEEKPIVRLRDALAHGRVSAQADGGTLRLIKFDEPDKHGKVRVVFNELLTADWFKAQKAMVHAALLEVYGELPQSARTPASG